MISASKLRNGVCFVYNEKPYRVLDYKHKHLSRGSGTIKVKTLNLDNSRQENLTFKSGDKLEEIDVYKKRMQYLYPEGESLVFMDGLTYDQIEVNSELVESGALYLKSGEEYDLLLWDERVLGVNLPPKVVMEIEDAAPGEKGDSASNIYKDATLIGGAKIRVPLFVNKGDKIRVDTRTGEYVERA